MPCLFAVLGLMIPRVVIVLLWFFSNWFDRIDGLLIPVLGFLFLPTTFLWYSAVQNWYGGQWGLMQIGIGVVAFLIDVSPAGGRRRRN